MQASVLFSVDFWWDTARLVDWENSIRAQLSQDNKLVPAIGCWKGEIEMSYLMPADDFYKLVGSSEAVAEQECIMLISPYTPTRVDVQYHEEEPKFFGYMKSVPVREALKETGWTFVPSLGQWFIVVQGNTCKYPEETVT